MTRGQIAIITDKGILTSTEFNGDMYMPNRKWAGHGRRVINALKRVYDIATYHYEVAKFNKENHHYNDETIVFNHNGYEMLNFAKDYFDNWFSDYIYIKNLTQTPKKLITQKWDKDGNTIGTTEIELQYNEIAVLYFGRLEFITH